LNYKNIIFNLIFALTCLFFVCWLWEKALLLTIILLIISIIGLYKWKNKETIVLFVICGIFGAVAEAATIYFGAWAYTLPGLVNIPYWLPILWGDAAVFIYRTGIEIKRI